MKSLTLAAVLILAGCTVAPASSPSVLPVSGVTVLPLSSPTTHCLGSLEMKQAVFSISSGPTFWQVFPRAGQAPELEGLETPLIVVAYHGVWPGTSTGVPNTLPPRTSPAPGTIDVCVETADGSPTIGGGQPFIVYGDIPVADSLVTP